MSVPPRPGPAPGPEHGAGPGPQWGQGRGYPPPGQPIPPPAPGPTSTLAAIFARSVLFPLMGITLWWGFTLVAGGVLGSQILTRLAGAGQCGPACWPTPTLAIVGCMVGLLIWVVGLITCWRRTVLWVWVGAGALVVVGTSLANVLILVL